MWSKIINVIMAVSLMYAGTYIIELKSNLEALNREFKEYKVAVDHKFIQIQEMENSREEFREEHDKKQTQAIKDVSRESVVVKKPMLVENMINKAFNKTMQSISESSK